MNNRICSLGKLEHFCFQTISDQCHFQSGLEGGPIRVAHPLLSHPTVLLLALIRVVLDMVRVVKERPEQTVAK